MPLKIKFDIANKVFEKMNIHRYELLYKHLMKKTKCTWSNCKQYKNPSVAPISWSAIVKKKKIEILFLH